MRRCSPQQKTYLTRRILILACLLLSVLLCPPVHAASASEYRLKAAFIYNFTKFVEWPASAFATPSTPLTIGVLGDNPFGTALNTLTGKTVKGRALKIVYFRRLAELSPCHVLFISASEEPRQTALLTRLKQTATLTIGDNLQKFSARGGMINFLFFGEQIRFSINAAAARQAGLKVNAQLLKLAAVVINE